MKHGLTARSQGGVYAAHRFVVPFRKFHGTPAAPPCFRGKGDGILTNEDTKGGVQVRELTMLIKQLVSQLRKAKPDCKLPEKAMVYLKRNGLINAEDILR